MKKTISIIAVITAFLAFSSPIHSQDNIVKLYPAGLMYNSGDGTGANYMFKWGYERVFTDKISAEFDMGIVIQSVKVDFGFGSTRATNTIFFPIDVHANYYILDDAPQGLYAGAYYFLGFGSVFMAGGAHIGYQHFFVDDQLALDARLGFGGGGWVSGCDGCGGFNMPFEVGAGWRF